LAGKFWRKERATRNINNERGREREKGDGGVGTRIGAQRSPHWKKMVQADSGGEKKKKKEAQRRTA